MSRSRHYLSSSNERRKVSVPHRLTFFGFFCFFLFDKNLAREVSDKEFHIVASKDDCEPTKKITFDVAVGG